MAMGEVRLCITKTKRKERTVFGTKKLREPSVKELFRLEVSNRFQELGMDEERWGQLKEVYDWSTKKVLVAKKKVKNDCVSGET